MRIIAVVILLVFTVAACAKRPEAVMASYTSPDMFAGMDCQALAMEQAKFEEDVQITSRLQRKARRRDKISYSIGTLVAWPAYFFAIGNNRDEELARTKGKVKAIDTIAAEKDCWHIVS